MGRKRKTGTRTKTDRLSRAKSANLERNPPSLRVIQRQNLFRQFKGDKALGHETTCAGRLMIVGVFDGMEADPEVILAALLEYSHAYWGNYGGGPAVASYERQDRTSSEDVTDDPRGQWFNRLDAMLCACGHQVRSAVHDVTVNRHWFPDEDVAWAGRLINSRFVAKGLPVAGEVACDSDYAMAELLRMGALALCGLARNKIAA